MTISGTITREMPSATGTRASTASTRNSNAHCAAKETSAMVATVRPTATLEPRVDETDPLHVGAREQGAEGAAEHEGR